MEAISFQSYTFFHHCLSQRCPDFQQYTPNRPKGTDKINSYILYLHSQTTTPILYL